MWPIWVGKHIWKNAINSMPKSVPKVSEFASRQISEYVPLPSPWFDWTTSSPPNIYFACLKSIFAIFALASCLWLALELAFAPFEMENLSSSIIFGLLDLFIVPLLLLVWLMCTIGLPSYFRLNRLAVRTRTLLFGSFPSVLAHTFVYIVIIAALCMLILNRFWSLKAGTFGWYLDIDLTIILILIVMTISISIEAFIFYIRYRPLPQLFINNNKLSVSTQCAKLTIAHWSDLHLTAGKTIPRIEDGSPGGNENLDRITNVYGTYLQQEVECIIVTGDITDTGAADEWKEFFRLSGYRLMNKMVIVPGNHDVNIPGNISSSLEDEHWQILILRTALAIDKVQGDKSVILDENGHVVSLSSYIRGASRHIADYLFLASKAKRNDSEKQRWREVQSIPESIWENIFPMAVSVPNTSLVVMVMNSNDRGSSVVTNAFGKIGSEQLDKLQQLRQLFKQYPQIIALHHHISDRLVKSVKDGGVFTFFKQMGMAVHDAEEFISRLLDFPALVLNGHRHVEYFACANSYVNLISASSTTLGDEATPNVNKNLRGFKTFGISWENDSVPTVISETSHWIDTCDRT